MIFRKASIEDVPELSQLRVDMLNEENAYRPEFNTLLSNNTKEVINKWHRAKFNTYDCSRARS